MCSVRHLTGASDVGNLSPRLLGSALVRWSTTGYDLGVLLGGLHASLVGELELKVMKKAFLCFSYTNLRSGIDRHLEDKRHLV